MYLYICVDVERENICIVLTEELCCGLFFFFSLMHLQVFNLIYSRKRKSLSLLFTVTLPAKWIDGKFFRGKSRPRFYVFCSYVSSFTSVLPVCWEEQAFWRGLAHLDKPSGRVSRPREKVRESNASSEPVVISMWE